MVLKDKTTGKDMKNAIKELAGRIEQTKDMIQTEEATKNAYIMPFLQILGYDVFNPLEIVPEFTADMGNKEGEKVDYAIIINGKPMILIECKSCNNELNVKNESQLLRYFATTAAKFGILTNGITYKFYSDLVEPNKMDLTPFLTVDLAGDLEKIKYSELAKFSKETFDAENVRNTAENLKYSAALRQAISEELTSPSDEFVKLLFKKMSPTGVFTAAQKNKLSPLAKTTIESYINDKVNAKLDAALKTATEAQEETETAHETILGAETDIVTTPKEIEGYNIVKAILSEVLAPDRIKDRDAKSYFAILLDDNNRKPLIRLAFNNEKRLAVIFFDGPKEEKVFINSPDDIFKYRDRLLATVEKYLPAENNK